MFLKGVENASEWVRHAIDDVRIREPTASSTNRAVLLAQQIRDLEQQENGLRENPILVEAQEHIKFDEAGFLGENWERLLSPELLASGLEAKAKSKAIIEGFEREIEPLSAKRKALEEELLRESQKEGGSGGTSATT